MSKCWYQLKIDKPVFNANWVRPTVTKSSHIWIEPAQDVYDSKWLQHVKSVIGIPLGINLTFYNDPTVVQQYGHIDVSINTTSDVLTQHSAINWVDRGAGSEMVWFQPKPDAEQIEVSYTEAGTPFKRWPLSSLTRIHSAHLTDVTLVQTDIPHNIVMGSEERWTFSVRPRWDFNYEWEKMVEFLNKRAVLL